MRGIKQSLLLATSLLACGGGGDVGSDASGVRVAGLVREVQCDGDDAGITLGGSSPAHERVALTLAPTSLVGDEPLGPGCEGLGQILGLEVDAVGSVAADGSWITERVDVRG